MRTLSVWVAAFCIALIGTAWAIVGETTVTVTDRGKPVAETKITLTFKTEQGRPIRKITTTNRRKVKIPDGTKRVDIAVTTRRKKETRTDIDVGLLIGRDYPIEIPGADDPPGTATPNDPSGPIIGGGIGGRTTVCDDWHTRDIVTFNIADPIGQERDRCLSSGVRGSIYIGTSTRVWNDWMAGVEADIGWANTKKTINGIPGSVGGVPGVTAAVAANDRTTMKETWDFSLRGRFGRFVTPSTVIYATGGLAVQSVDASVTCSATGACGVNGIPTFTQTNSKTMFGWTLGGGVETALTDRWVARGEYRYSDYGHWVTTLGTPAAFAVTTDIHMQTHTALIGLAYKLGR